MEHKDGLESVLGATAVVHLHSISNTGAVEMTVDAMQIQVQETQEPGPALTG